MLVFLWLVLLLLRGRSRDEGKTERDEGEGDIEKKNKEEERGTEALAFLEDSGDDGLARETRDQRSVHQQSWSGVCQGKYCTDEPQFPGEASVKEDRNKHDSCSKSAEREVGQVGCTEVDDGREKRNGNKNVCETLGVLFGILALNQDRDEERNDRNNTEGDDEDCHTVTALRKSQCRTDVEDPCQATEPDQLCNAKKSALHCRGREINTGYCEQQERAHKEADDSTVLSNRSVKIWTGQEVDVEAAMHVCQQVVETAQKGNCRFGDILLLDTFCRGRTGTITKVRHANCDGVHAILVEETVVSIRNTTCLQPNEPSEISKLSAILVDLILVQAKEWTLQHILNEGHGNIRDEVGQSTLRESSVAHCNGV